MTDDKIKLDDVVIIKKAKLADSDNIEEYIQSKIESLNQSQ